MNCQKQKLKLNLELKILVTDEEKQKSAQLFEDFKEYKQLIKKTSSNCINMYNSYIVIYIYIYKGGMLWKIKKRLKKLY
ncbi:hypothetical protein C4M94_00485 [Mycoplasmopsis pullorum]|nr:hypothetical protein C4M94_00485 [Mycoplasmopsis pullorum]